MSGIVPPPSRYSIRSRSVNGTSSILNRWDEQAKTCYWRQKVVGFSSGFAARIFASVSAIAVFLSDLRGQDFIESDYKAKIGCNTTLWWEKRGQKRPKRVCVWCDGRDPGELFQATKWTMLTVSTLST